MFSLRFGPLGSTIECSTATLGYTFRERRLRIEEYGIEAHPMSVTASAVPTATAPATAPAPCVVDSSHVLSLARDVLATEANAITGLAARLGPEFVAAVELILNCGGRVVVSGIGKSGHIARKVAATLASTGTPAFFVHPAEASHGDLGMITPADVVVMLSNSGETDELLLLTPHLKRQGAKIVALTGNEQSSIAQAADVHLDTAVDAEAGPLVGALHLHDLFRARVV